MNSSVLDPFIGEQSIELPPVAGLAATSSTSLWHWYHAVYLVLAWQTAVVIWSFWWKAPVLSEQL